LSCSPVFGEPSLTSFAQGYQVELPDLELLVCFGVLPWWQFPDFELPVGKRVLYVPFRGWLADQWHDGPLAHYVPQGYLSSYVPAGASAKLCLPMEFKPPAEEVIPYIRGSFTNQKIRSMAMRTSAAFGLRDRLLDADGEEHHRLKLEVFDQKSIALMCLLRIAFPDDSMELAILPDEKQLHVGWKRLCQNLDILCGKAPRPDGKTRLVELDQFRCLLPDSVLVTMLHSFNEHSDMVPLRLI